MPVEAQLQPAADVRGAAAAARMAWVDYAKAVAIILVVFGHASRSIDRTQGLVWSDALRSVDALIYSFHIPLFFILAGFTASLQRGRPLPVQMRGLLWGIVVPYVVWTIVWVGLKLLFPDSVNSPLTLSHLVHALWQPVEHLWFLQHLLIARVLWLLLEGTVDERRFLILGSVAVLLMLADCALISGSDHTTTNVAYILGNAGLFGAGLVWGPKLLEWRGRSGLLLAAAALGVVWLGLELMVRPVDSSVPGILAALAASAAVIIAVWSLPPPQGYAARAFAFIGEASLAIYLIHPIIIGVVRAVLTKAGLLSETALLFAGTGLGLILPAVAFAVALAVSDRTRRPLLRWSGLGTARLSYYWPLVPLAPAALRPNP